MLAIEILRGELNTDSWYSCKFQYVLKKSTRANNAIYKSILSFAYPAKFAFDDSGKIHISGTESGRRWTYKYQLNSAEKINAGYLILARKYKSCGKLSLRLERFRLLDLKFLCNR